VNKQLLNSKIKIFTNWAWAFVYFGLIVSVFGLFCYVFPSVIEELSLNELGDFYAGSVASSWSLAGLFFIYVAFLGQKQQLINQQIELLFNQGELKATRIELSGQREQLFEQNKTFKQQRFENTFFQLLANHMSTVNSIDIRQKSDQTGEYSISAQGKDCFKIFYNRFYKKCKTKAGKVSKIFDVNELNMKDVLQSYMEFFTQNQADLGHYFRNMYHILKFINEEDIIKNKKRYSNLLRAHLSSYELSILFYNGLGDYGTEKFKPLIEQFSFLKNLDIDLIISREHINEYDESAFKTKKQSTTKNIRHLADSTKNEDDSNK
jgi:hypothetical protein